MERVKAKRGARRGQVTKIINEAVGSLADACTTSQTFSALLERLQSSARELSSINDEVEALVDDEHMAQEYASVLEYEDNIVKTMALLKAKIREFSQSTPGTVEIPAESAERANGGRSSRIRLPRLQLQPFRGDLAQWQPFWEQFRIAIHENEELSGSEKFQYLRTLLSGRAAAAIAGLQATDACYRDAIDLLTRRFGDHKRIEMEHLGKLRSLPVVTTANDARSLRKLYDHLQVHIRGLQALGIPPSTYATLLVDIVLRALPAEITIEYHRRSAHTSAGPVQRDARQMGDQVTFSSELDGILEFLRVEVESREKTPGNDASKFESGGTSAKGKKSRPSAAVLHAGTKTTPKCVFCNSERHETGNCDAPIDLERRKRTLASEGRCFRCTFKGHRAKDCRRKVTCSTCKGKHLTSLCDPDWNSAKSTGTKEVDATAMCTSSAGSHEGNEVVLLQTFRAWVVSEKQSTYIRGIFDGGSQKTFIRQDISRRLRLQVLEEIDVRLNTFGDPKAAGTSHRRSVVQLRLRSQYDKEEHLIEAVEIPFICKDLVEAPASQPMVEDIRKGGGCIADALFFPGVKAEPGIGLLVGADQMWKLVNPDVRRSRESSRTVAVSTKLGWRFHGPVAIEFSSVKSTKVLACALHVGSVSGEVCMDVQKFWELECLGITDDGDKKHPEDDAVFRDFERTVVKENGRYKVALPWKAPDTTFGDNRRVAERRLGNLVKKLQSNSARMIEYDAAMRKYVHDGHAEVVNDEQLTPSGHVYYMPHQAVIREYSTTTRLRVVFDASSHAPDTASLNAHLEKGPKLNTELLSLLLRFRIEKIALVADIAKAFLQIIVREEDRDALRFLWFKHPPLPDVSSPSVEVWRMTRVPFGTTSSPFLLAATILHHLNNVHEMKGTAEKLARSFYVDDLLTGAPNEKEAERIYMESTAIMKLAGMDLRKWASNSATMEQHFEEREVGCSRESSSRDKETSLLGLVWNRSADQLGLSERCAQRHDASKGSTKRVVLQTAASIFDPLGLASPFTVRAKLLFQRMWQAGLEWDQELPAEMANEWARWCEELQEVQRIQVPRYVARGIGKPVGALQVHIFTDASPSAYGAVIYLRVQDCEDKVAVTLMMAKSRIAPLKSLSLPRLELMGALIGSRLAKVVRNALSRWDLEWYYWTDSMIVLAWIKGSAIRWKQFVRNRVAEIQAASEPSSWKHCPGEQNPADCLTRGEAMDRLLTDKKWWQGPAWLAGPVEHWPGLTPMEVVDDDALRTERAKAQVLLVNADATSSGLLELENYSKLNRVLRVTAWVYRFVKNCRAEDKVRGHLKAEEILKAEEYWVKETQRVEYKRELQDVRQKGSVDAKSPIAGFQPQLDENYVMRISGRLQYASLPADVRHPILLPNGRKFTELVVEAAHQRLLHAGIQDTIAEVRERYWIPRDRQLAKKVLFRCTVCIRHRAKPASAPVAPLPSDRVKESGPFKIVGIDFAGPLFVKTERGEERKSYVALFTCATTRAVHLELVSNMTASCFLLAFRRFTSRRGLPSVVYTDNATTFKKAEKIIWKALKGNELQDHLSTVGIQWKFIMERAPWWGGFWERLIRTVKNTLRKVLGRNCFSFEELTTILHGVESVVNSRPLTAASEDPNDDGVLTPAHFLAGKRLTSLPDFDVDSRESSSSTLRKTWKMQQQLLDRFWVRWRKEYLLQLRSVHHAKNSGITTTPLQVGDIVLVHNEKTPRHMWNTGRIVEVFRGRDDIIRGCAVKLASGTVLRRPVQLLYPLEVF